ncbi:MAG: signal peptidase I [Firmicutes bacterium]|jgi:signal peptidase I|nr:signal peptidase I [Bacillota bacterium]
MQDVKVVVVERNIDNIAVEMILEAMKQGQPVVVYGTGTSMEPTICRGDAITVVPCKDIRVGDIVLIFLALDCLVVHRVIDIGTLWGRVYVQTKGDNNKEPDPRRAIEFVVGKVVKIEKVSNA